jgi:hypothetical protein
MGWKNQSGGMQMKVIFHCGYDGKPDESWYDDCFLDNRPEPVVRKAGEPFKSCYDIEWSYRVCHVIDPGRSLAKPVIDLLEGCIADPHWENCDCLSVLIADMAINRRQPSREDVIAFWTMFPDGVAEALSNCYMKDSRFLGKYRDAVRVLNNPFFHKDPNANERRLVEIAEDNGLRFALDRIAVLPPPDVLAREIALLNHGIRDPEKVEPIQSRLAASIAETMSDWGLKPTV